MHDSFTAQVEVDENTGLINVVKLVAAVGGVMDKPITCYTSETIGNFLSCKVKDLFIVFFMQKV